MRKRQLFYIILFQYNLPSILFHILFDWYQVRNPDTAAGDLFAGEDFQGPNEFVLRMQPEEELYLKMTIKKPGLGMHIVPSEMQLSDKWKQNQYKCVTRKYLLDKVD